MHNLFLKSFTVAVLLFFVFSCKQVFQKYESEAFQTMAWSPENEIEFNPVIEDTSLVYNVKLGLRHMYGISTERLHLKIRIIDPAGNEVHKNYSFPIKDEEGDFVTDCVGEYCDSEIIFQLANKFQIPGTWKYYISTTEDSGIIPGILEFGLIIEKQ